MPKVCIPGINDIKTLLQKLNVYWRFNPLPYPITKQEIDEIRIKSYINRYIFTYCRKLYSFILKDLSLIGFEDKDSGFYYFQSPFMNLDEYFKSYGLGNEYFLQDSDFMLDELKIKQYPFYVRYDYSEVQYAEGRHPAAHIHLGIDTEIRIACEKKLNPLSFVLFVLRQFYPDIWIDFCTLDSLHINRDVILKNIRANLDNVPIEYRKGNDYAEMYFV